MKSLGLKYEYLSADVKQASKLSYNASFNSITKTVTGYDYLVAFSKYSYDRSDKNISNFTIDSVEYHLDYFYKPTVKLSLKSKTDTIDFDLEDLANKLKKEYGNHPEAVLPVSKMQMMRSGKLFEIKIEFHSIEMEKEKDGLRLNNLSGDLFIKKKE